MGAIKARVGAPYRSLLETTRASQTVPVTGADGQQRQLWGDAEVVQQVLQLIAETVRVKSESKESGLDQHVGNAFFEEQLALTQETCHQLLNPSVRSETWSGLEDLCLHEVSS